MMTKIQHVFVDGKEASLYLYVSAHLLPFIKYIINSREAYIRLKQWTSTLINNIIFLFKNLNIKIYEKYKSFLFVTF